MNMAPASVHFRTYIFYEINEKVDSTTVVIVWFWCASSGTENE